MSAHDRYLEAPYVQAARREAALEAFCEAEGFAFDDPAALDAFEAREAALEDQLEAQLAAQLEREAEL